MRRKIGIPLHHLICFRVVVEVWVNREVILSLPSPPFDYDGLVRGGLGVIPLKLGSMTE